MQQAPTDPAYLIGAVVGVSFIAILFGIVAAWISRAVVRSKFAEYIGALVGVALVFGSSVAGSGAVRTQHVVGSLIALAFLFWRLRPRTQWNRVEPHMGTPVPQETPPESDPHATVPPAIPVEPDYSQESYFLRHWRGHLPLAVSYWVNGALITVMMAALIAALPKENHLWTRAPQAMAGAVLLVIVASIPMTVWQLVGIGRSARIYMDAGKSKLWGTLAILAVVFGAVRALVDFGYSTLPVAKEQGQILLGLDSLGAYNVRVIRGGRELEVTGMLSFGVSNEVERMLNAYPTIKVVHLNSGGGRVAEGRALRDLIASRSLVTYTATSCFSACTLAYMAGRERWISRDGQLGFHQYRAAGMRQAQMAADYRIDTADWTSRGISPEFSELAFSKANSDLWRPTHKELLAAHVVTRYPNSGEVGLSGAMATNNVEEALAGLDRVQIYNAIGAADPDLYRTIRERFRVGIVRGESIDDIRAEIFPRVIALVRKRLPSASNEALEDFAVVMTDEMRALYKVDPALCYDYVFGEAANKAVNALPREILEREAVAMAHVIESSGTPRSPISPATTKVLMGRAMKDLYAVHGEKTALLAEPKRMAQDKKLGCQLTHDFYKALLAFPPYERGLALRTVFTPG